MSNINTTPLPQWQADRLAVLLDALDGVPISGEERRTLTWLAGWEPYIVENVAAVITRVRLRNSEPPTAHS